MTTTAPFGINPLPWILDAETGFHLNEEVLRDAFATVSSLGFRAVQADVPPTMTLEGYRDLLAEFQLASAPGYFGAVLDDPQIHSENIDAARKHAQIQRSLGLSEVFVASDLTPTRRAHPAVGADFDESRLHLVIDNLADIATAISAEGLTPALHPHVGSWIETEHEIRAVFDAIPASVLGFGPDTGHLTWAGMNAARMIADYSDRVVGVHLKDVDLQERSQAISEDLNYVDSTTRRKVWTEPGRGGVDFTAVFAALPSNFSGWFVLEVDVPNIGSAVESTAESARWIRRQPRLTGALA